MASSQNELGMSRDSGTHGCRACGSNYRCLVNDRSACCADNNSKNCKEKHMSHASGDEQCTRAKETDLQRTKEAHATNVRGMVPKCAGCGGQFKILVSLDPNLKHISECAKSPLLCADCLAKYSEGDKVCSADYCLCTDNAGVGTSFCPIKSHRGQSSLDLFVSNSHPNQTCVQCFRCRERRRVREKHSKQIADAAISTYTEDEIKCWKAATGFDELPELRKLAADQPTFFSDEMAADCWCAAQIMLYNWESDTHEMYPSSQKKMTHHWVTKTYYFVRTFSPKPREYTKEIIEPIRAGMRLLLELSNVLHKSPSPFQSLAAPKLEEWLELMKLEPSYDDVVKCVHIPILKCRGLLPPSYGMD